VALMAGGWVAAELQGKEDQETAGWMHHWAVWLQAVMEMIVVKTAREAWE
jgi:hypothetical protein